MNTRTRALVASVAVVGALLAGASTALATPGLDSRACDRATSAHLDAKKAHRDAEKAAEKFEKDAQEGKGKDAQSLPDNVKGISGPEQDKLDALNGTVARLKGELDKAEKERADKCADPKPEPKPVQDPKPPFVDKDCKDLTPAEAQALLNADKSDPHLLDADKDGVPCELDEGEDDNDRPRVVVIERQVEVVPNTDDGVETGGL